MHLEEDLPNTSEKLTSLLFFSDYLLDEEKMDAMLRRMITSDDLINTLLEIMIYPDCPSEIYNRSMQQLTADAGLWERFLMASFHRLHSLELKQALCPPPEKFSVRDSEGKCSSSHPAAVDDTAASSVTEKVNKALKHTVEEISCIKKTIDDGVSAARAMDLGWVLKKASGQGHTGIVAAFMENARFSQISPRDLGWALREASGQGHTAIVAAFMENVRFSQISQMDLDWALQKASERGYGDIIQLLLRFNRGEAVLFRR